MPKTKLLLHACCAPCSSGVVPQLIDTWDITLLFYNPNINTEEEFNRRAKAMELYVKKFNKEFKSDIKLVIIPYEHDKFIIGARGQETEPEGGKRCDYCIAMRLGFTAEYAKDNGYNTFASTLSVSPHKNYKTINNIGEILSEKYSVNYLPSNFKKNNGFLNSIRNSTKYGLYRQGYCGCEYALAIQQQKSAFDLPTTNG
ncbi:MAG: epoxyqueuosine reductase QueH [Clostridiales bacterium]|nr:epoxyqueuosine reductase QueH [Clostridiales bacterium]